MSSNTTLVRSFDIRAIMHDIETYMIATNVKGILVKIPNDESTILKAEFDIKSNVSQANLNRLVEANRYSITMDVKEKELTVKISTNTFVSIDDVDIEEEFCSRLFVPKEFFDRPCPNNV